MNADLLHLHRDTAAPQFEQRVQDRGAFLCHASSVIFALRREALGEGLELADKGGAGQVGDVEGKDSVALDFPLLTFGRGLQRDDVITLGLPPECLGSETGFDPQAK